MYNDVLSGAQVQNSNLRVLVGWLLSAQESLVYAKALGKPFLTHLQRRTYKVILKFTAHTVLLAIGKHPGNFRRMELALLV